MSRQIELSSMKYRLFTSLWLIAFTLLLLNGCGDGPVDTPKTDTQTEALVSGMITDIDTNDTVPDSEISEDAYGRRIARTKLMIAFNADATADEATALLDSINAVITSSIEDARSLVVRIPDPGDLDAYDAIVADIEAESFVDFVMKGEMPEALDLPANYYSPPSLSELPFIDHHLALRVHAAWNARKAINRVPRLLMADKFGNGAPSQIGNDYIDTFPDFYPFSATDLPQPSYHGYHVLGIISGVFTSNYTIGIFPNTIDLRAIDLQAGLDMPTTLNKILDILRTGPGKWVVNTSIGYQSCTGEGGHCISIDTARQHAELWVEEVRRLGLENRVLHITSAGNIETPPGNQIRDAETASVFASARLLPGLTDVLGDPLANLSNTLVVENAVNTVVDPSNIQPVAAKCLSVDSFVGGDLAAIGTNVWSYVNNTNTINNASENSGTSMSAPEVTGLAAYLWSIDSAPSAQQILTAIYANARPLPVINGDPQCSDWPGPAPVIDAYASLLSLDATATPTPVNSPVRFAILDVNNDGDFDETDLALFIDTYFDTSTQPPTPIEPSEPDYGRYDLNGDGWTGGSATDAFDLDRTGSVQYGLPVLGSAEQDIEGKTIRFDENSLTDMQMLCYYAWSPLYTGDTDERQRLMSPYLDQCGGKAWGTPTVIGRGYLHDLAGDEAGNAVAVSWQQGGLQLARHDKDTGWEAPVSQADGWTAQVAMGDSGTIVVYLKSTGEFGARAVFATRYLPGSGWQAATNIDTGSTTYSNAPHVAMDTAGNASVVWENNGTKIRFNRYAAGAGWETALAFVTGIDDDVSSPAVAKSRNGYGMAVWEQYDGANLDGSSRKYIYASYQLQDGGWQTPRAVEACSARCDNPKVAVSDSGNAVVVWQASSGGSDSIRASVFVPGTGWGSVRSLVDPGNGRAFRPEVAVDNAGNAIAIWEHVNTATGGRSIWANYYDKRGGWQGAQRITTDAVRASNPRIAMQGASGKAIAVWQQDGHVHASQYSPGDGWRNTETIDTDAGTGGPPQIVIDGDGNAVAVWSNGGIVYANRYE